MPIWNGVPIADHFRRPITANTQESNHSRPKKQDLRVTISDQPQARLVITSAYYEWYLRDSRAVRYTLISWHWFFIFWMALERFGKHPRISKDSVQNLFRIFSDSHWPLALPEYPRMNLQQVKQPSFTNTSTSALSVSNYIASPGIE